MDRRISDAPDYSGPERRNAPRRKLERLLEAEARRLEGEIIRTTVGRVIFNQIWPTGLGFINFPVPKSKLGDLILNTYKIAGPRDVPDLEVHMVTTATGHTNCGAMGLGGKDEQMVASTGTFMTAIDYKTGKIAWKSLGKTKASA